MDIITNLQEKKQISLFLLSKDALTKNQENDFKNNLKKNFEEITISQNEKPDTSGLSSSIYVTGISILIFIVAIVNIMAMTLFWILDRTKEIAVRKVLGFINSDIIGLILKEMMSIGLISVIIAVIMQIVINILAQNLFNIELHMKLNNLIISIIVVIMSVIITSIVPIKIILKTKLTEILN